VFAGTGGNGVGLLSPCRPLNWIELKCQLGCVVWTVQSKWTGNSVYFSSVHFAKCTKQVQFSSILQLCTHLKRAPVACTCIAQAIMMMMVKLLLSHYYIIIIIQCVCSTEQSSFQFTLHTSTWTMLSSVICTLLSFQLGFSFDQHTALELL